MKKKSLDEYADLLDADDLSEYLDISKRSTYRLLRSGAIKSIRVGREYRIPKAHIMTYLQIPHRDIRE